MAGGDPYNYWDSVSASINGHAYFYGYEGNGNFDSQSNASFSLHSYYYDHTPQSQSGNLVFGIFASGPGSGSLGIDFSASTGGSASMVPEPESYAMLLAGLGLMGAVIRRRTWAKMSESPHSLSKLFFTRNRQAAFQRRPFLLQLKNKHLGVVRAIENKTALAGKLGGITRMQGSVI